jgi:tRNA(Ile)-lysidine synthase
MGRAEPLTLEEIRPTFARLLRGPLALAVSGGADSMALMHLLAEWVREPGTAERHGMGSPPLRVLTVDHALRASSAEEAAWVGREAGKLGLPHETLIWDEAKPGSGIQAAAREARYRLIGQALARERLARPDRPTRCIVTGHHANDQAETFLMRLARGSGLDGLSGMREEEPILLPAGPGQAPVASMLVRPLLHIPKARLVSTLQSRGLPWREDPSNQSSDFERVRVREAVDVLGRIGIDVAQVSLSTSRLGRARAASLTTVRDLLPQLTRLHDGVFAEIDARLFSNYAEDYQVRILAALLRAYGGESEPARLSQIEALVAQLNASLSNAGGPPGRRWASTLGGCQIERDGSGAVRLWRELGRPELPEIHLQPGAQEVWDGRFLVALAKEEAAPVLVRALGRDGLRAHLADVSLVEPAHASAPRGALKTLPSFWREQRLLAVPTLTSGGDAPTAFSALFVAQIT